MEHTSSRWNRMKSIPMSEICENELTEAIHEWAEGCESLEKLLLYCKKNDVETCGCHFGHGSYLAIRTDSGKQKVAQMVAKTLELSNTQILIQPNAGNPFSGPDWYRDSINFGSNAHIPEGDSLFFRELSNALEFELSPSLLLGTAHTLLELYYFLKGKESELDIRLKHLDSENYIISFESWNCQRIVDHHTKLFEKVGLQPIIKENLPIVTWETYPITREDLYNRLSYYTRELLKSYSLPLPSEISKDMRFSARAMVMRRKFGTDAVGIAKMNDWINTHLSHGQSPVNYK